MASGTPRAGRNARIYIDCSSAGTMAVGTLNTTLVNSKNKWTFDQSPAYIDVTAFEATSIQRVIGIADGQGDIGGNWDATGTLVYNLINAPTERALLIFPDWVNNPEQYVSGKAFFGLKYGGDLTGAVSNDIHFVAGPTGLAWTHP